MKMLFKQRFFSWFDSYDIFDEEGNTIYVVKGQLSWGHKLNVYDAAGNYLGTVKERVLTFTPTFELYLGGDEPVGVIRRRFFSLFKPLYEFSFNGWEAAGDILEWDYEIKNPDGTVAASVSKELFRWTDTYSIDVEDPGDALMALMFVLAVDAEKCSR
ncbi:MAG: LURP-one-related family protein [Clostridiales bacterium]|nr:LURP-one-related family protein [Clostridiales bacterium]